MSMFNSKLTAVSLSIIGFIVILVVWGNRFEPRWLEITSHEVIVDNLPDSWQNQQIAFISDFQIGMWLGNDDILPSLVDELVKKKPKFVLIGGDFIYHPTDDDKDDAKEEWAEDDKLHTNELVNKAVSYLAPLTDAGIAVFAVLGNHDYSMGHNSARIVEESAKHLTNRLQSIGVEVLNNEARPVDIGGDKVYAVGIAPHYPDFDNVTDALQQVPANQAKVLFMHNANSLQELDGDSFSFAVAGHTHGGQFRIPGFPSWTWMSLVHQSKDEVKGDGWIKNYKGGQAQLYINRGIGFSTLPLRVNCRPELTLFKLKGS